MIKSIYQNSTILSSDTDVIAPFVLQEELIKDYGCVTKLFVAYTADGNYIGDKEQAELLISKGITEQVQPIPSGKTCSIGFNPYELKWYGWSHRAMYGFGIGSEVKIGDCAYRSKDVDDLIKSMLLFWEVDSGFWRECESPDITCTTLLLSIDPNYINEDGHEGVLINTETKFRGADRDYTSRHFTEYPNVWGKGEWTAFTLDDAKQMAIDFSDGVS